MSDSWAAYRTLDKEGYTHKVINHSEYFVDPEDSFVHTQNIERLWRNVKEWAKRPGLRTEYFEQYFGRYLFLDFYGDDAHHQFFLEAGKLYPPHGTRQVPTDTEDIPDSDVEPGSNSDSD